MRHASRRTILIAAGVVAAAGALPALAQAAQELGAVAVFEADEPTALAFASGRSPRLAIDGDRVRFARKLFQDMRPGRVAAMTRYADYLLLSGAAREHGYRTVLTGPSDDALFAWTAERIQGG
jgi:hypothetical protein